jgi:hypothetical protein
MVAIDCFLIGDVTTRAEYDESIEKRYGLQLCKTTLLTALPE